MKKLIILIFIFSLNLASAAKIDNRWNAFFNKEVTVTCEYSHEYAQCEEICGDKYYCVIPEQTCRNCLGTSPYMTHIFKEMGKVYVSRDLVTDYELIDLLRSGNFVSINSKSIYNQVTKWNSNSLRHKFQSLCQGIKDENPLVFFEMDEISLKLGQVKFVECRENGESKIFQMVNDGDFEINSSIDLNNSLF